MLHKYNIEAHVDVVLKVNFKLQISHTINYQYICTYLLIDCNILYNTTFKNSEKQKFNKMLTGQFIFYLNYSLNSFTSNYNFNGRYTDLIHYTA